jgi:hypothetical protein
MVRTIQSDDHAEHRTVKLSKPHHQASTHRTTHDNRLIEIECRGKRHDDLLVEVAGEAILILLPSGRRRRLAMLRQIKR